MAATHSYYTPKMAADAYNATSYTCFWWDREFSSCKTCKHKKWL